MHSCKKYINLSLRFLIVFLILVPPAHSQASNQCSQLFTPQNTYSFSPFFESNFSTSVEALANPKEVERAFEQLKSFMYKDGSLTSEYLNLKSSLVKKSLIPFKKSQVKYRYFREDGEVDKISYLQVLSRIEEGVKEIHPEKVRNIADFLTIAKARQGQDKLDYKDAEALENLYRKVETNMDAMRGKPKAKVNPVKIFKDAGEFLKDKNSRAYTIKGLLSGAIVDAIAVMMFRYMEMSTGQSFFQTEMLFYFAQSYFTFQVMLLLSNPIYTNTRLTHRQSFVKTYATSVGLYTVFVPVFRFLHDQFLGGSPIPVSPMMMGVYTASMGLYTAFLWKPINEILFRKVISPIFFEHFLKEDVYREIIDVNSNTKEQLLEKYYSELKELNDKIKMIETVHVMYWDVFSKNTNGKYSESYNKVYKTVTENSEFSKAKWEQVLQEHFGINEHNPRVKHPSEVERDLFALKNQIKGAQEKIRWTNYFRKGLAEGQPVPKRRRAFYFSYEQVGRVFTASVMISAFIIGQKMLVGESLFDMDGMISQIIAHMSGMYDSYNQAGFGQ